MPSGYKHADETKRAMVRGTISYLESQGLPVNKSAIFRHFGITRSQGYSAMSVPSSKRNDPAWEETRGRPSKISAADVEKMEAVLWDPGYESMSLNWASLAAQAGVPSGCNPRTIHRAMGTLGFRLCLRCGRSSVGAKNKERRVEFARRMADARPTPQEWRAVRFSGELHFGFSVDGRVRLLPRAGERQCATCRDEAEEEEWPRDARRVHAWAALGYGFKSELLFYDDATGPNSTGALSMDEYKSKVLNGVVLPWLQAGQVFALEEDADEFAHGGASKVNTVQEWKAAHALQAHFGCSESPDLSLLDSVWPPGKQWANGAARDDWDDETLKQAAKEAWAAIDLERVNLWVDFMPARLKEVIDSHGRMVAW